MMYTTDATHPTDLVGKDTGALISTLAAKSGGYTQSEFTVNKWGYKWSFSGNATTDENLHNPKTNYFPILDNAHNGNALTVTSQNSNAETTTVTLATKLDNETPADRYSTTLSFVILANSSTDTSTFDAAFYANGKTTYTYTDGTGATVNTGLYAMQDMTSTICSTVPTPSSTTEAPEARLVDKRDNKIYWVAKLKDGKCWMTQGLDLDLSTSVTLNHSNSDIGYAHDGYTENTGKTWLPVNSTEDSTTKTITVQTTNNNVSSADFAPGWDNNTANDVPFSSDPGDRYVAPNVATQTYTNYWDLQDSFYNSLTACNAAMTSSTFNKDCTHYALGNYYNFAAATATNSVSDTVGHTITNADNYKVMPDSICPANWRLPKDITGSVTNGTTSNYNSEFDTLLYAYSVTNLVGATANQALYWNNNSQTTGYTALNTMRNTPLYFTRPGVVNGGTLYLAGVNGDSWSSTISAASFGYSLGFSSTRVIPADSYNRLRGVPVHCIAR